jgi:DNA-directed RNA polymerase III subunit RPC4
MLTRNIDRKTNNRTPSTFGSGSGSRATRIKNEGDGDYAGSNSRSGGGGGGGGGGSSGGGGFGRTYVKRDNGESGSEDEDVENAEFPRKDIDYIEISSDDHEAPPADRPQRATLPVRIGRKEHNKQKDNKDKASTGDGSPEPAENPEAADEKPTIEGLKQPSGKGKGKAKVVIPTLAKKPFKGVWQDPEDDEEQDLGDAVQVGIRDALQQTTGDQDPSRDSVRKMKRAVKGFATPILQTLEDTQEWARFQKNLTHIRAELGPEDTPAVDPSGDVNMEDVAAAAAKKPTVRDNNVYLFQIPPRMPEVHLHSVKEGPADAEDESALAPPVKPEVKIKVEEGFSETSTRAASAFAGGCVGRVRVRQSGRTTLDWGGTSYELNPGNKVSFLSELCRLHVTPEQDRVAPEDAGEATSFGRVKGKFVVVPDWSLMLG